MSQSAAPLPAPVASPFGEAADAELTPIGQSTDAKGHLGKIVVHMRTISEEEVKSKQDGEEMSGLTVSRTEGGVAVENTGEFRGVREN